jgi:hypothetical protein
VVSTILRDICFKWPNSSSLHSLVYILDSGFTASSLLMTATRLGPSFLKSTSTQSSVCPLLPALAASSSGPGLSRPSTTRPSSLRFPPRGGCTVGLMHFSVHGGLPDLMRSINRFLLASSSSWGTGSLDTLPYAVGALRLSRCCAAWCSKKNCGGKRMIRPSCARRSHADAGKKRAVVCSRPPSVVGVGMDTSGSNSSPFVASDWTPESGVADDVGRKYMYIWVVKRFGTFVGVTHRVNGINPSLNSQ